MSLLRPLVIGQLVLPHNVLLAPLAGITNHAFRLICRREGACLAFTEMVSVNGMVREGEKTWELLQSSDEDRPLGVQLFGDDPELLARAAELVGDRADLIDINMGCPVRKVVGTGAGSALLKDTARIAAIVKAVRRATRLPLTIKIRTGWDRQDETWREAGRIAEAEGCDAITLHPRSRSQMFEGSADWSRIAALKALVGIPVIGSGDLFTAEDCRRMLAETGCDGIMAARGAMGNPWIFRQARELLEGRPVRLIGPAERATTARSHLELFVEQAGAAVALREMKKHLGWYIHGISGAASLRRAAHGARSLEELRELLDRIGGMGA
ncbi:putative tRNA-dihydrouridine synthase 1 [Trichlorobacter ammonificans]|uniref:tRNA-dihydrouridine synthase n=1 Tax=Trichlorobacter ammonificans TaxID=2916410 RepID=A0ABM9DBU0_9BACT|nr:putative tRNA-dihydrouridine synthase 1 [Trichlorobacter ammonificans]